MDGFGDLLEDIRNDGGELIWITKKKKFLENEFARKRSPEEIKQSVIKSQAIRHAIDQIVEQNRRTETDPAKHLRREDIVKESEEIMDEMGHLFDLKYVRVLGYVLMKVFRKIYKHIFYNKDINENMKVLKHSPCVLLPLHRSYMDFLLVSIICFHKNIQLPAIAAGMDFMGLSFLAQVIRHCGAFFIRRSFGSDKLYWALFNEYVQQHLLNCDRPLEFFIEGTRSRTSKSLPPKHGMLASCLELYLKEHRVYDIYLIPISLTYERLLEEILYSTELLGIPKPKESVSGLVKARSILGECYGSIFVNFGRPMSFREMIFHLRGTRGLYSSLAPNFVFELKPEQLQMISSVCYTVLLNMLQNQVIQPISLIATCLLLAEQKNTLKPITQYEWSHFMRLDRLIVETEVFRGILTNLGARVYWPAESSIEDSTNQAKNIILDNLETHANLFELYNLSSQTVSFVDNVRLARDDKSSQLSFIIGLKKEVKVGASKSYLTKAQSFENAKSYIAVCSYRNQLVSFLVRKSFACVALLGSSQLLSSASLKIHNEQSFNAYSFLSKLFNKEYILKDGDELHDYDDAIKFLVHMNILKRQDSLIFEIIKLNIEKFIFISKVFQSVMENYSEIYLILIEQSRSSFNDEKQLILFVQDQVFKKLEVTRIEHVSYDLEILSLNLISNSVLALSNFKILEKVFSPATKKFEYKIDLNLLSGLNKKLLSIISENKLKLGELSRVYGQETLNNKYNSLNESKL